MAQLMDRLGYNTFWMAEHHFQHEGYECIPNVLLYAVHLAHVTQRLRIGCGFNITPMWHPLRLAEDFATADILTGGRVIAEGTPDEFRESTNPEVRAFLERDFDLEPLATELKK